MGNTLYVGGEYTTIAGQARNRLASFDLTTGNLNAWNPNVIGVPPSGGTCTVNAIYVNGSTVYIGGIFTGAGGQPRACVAAVDAVTALGTAWNPAASGGTNSGVYALAGSGSIFIGGTFSNIGAAECYALAKVDMTTGVLAPWHPNPAPLLGGGLYGVYSMAIDGNTLYVGGFFLRMNEVSYAAPAPSGYGQTRRNLAAVDINTGLLTPWICHTNNFVYTLSLGGNGLMVGGSFISAGGQPLDYVAGIDLTNQAVLPWTSSTDNVVRTLAVSGNDLYIGGDFSQPRYLLAALDKNTGVFRSSFNSGFTGPANTYQIYALVVSAGYVYAGGNFPYLYRGSNHTNFAQLDANTGAVGPWDPGTVIGGPVRALLVNGNTIYAGGDFTIASSVNRAHLVAYNPFALNPNPWDPPVTGTTISALALNGNMLYVGGDFTAINGQPVSNLAAVDYATSLINTTFKPNPNAPVSALALDGNTLYAGGSFTNIAGNSRNRLAALNSLGNLITGFDPNMNAPVLSLAADGINLFVGGAFTTVQNRVQNHLATFTLPSAAPLPVRLLSFSAKAEQAGPSCKVNCEWMTASEQNSRSFVVEKSTDGRNYQPVGSVAAAGNSTSLQRYQLTDPAPAAGISYYRLKQEDADGRISYSTIALVNINGEEVVVLLFPNPVQHQATVIISTPQTAAIAVPRDKCTRLNCW